MSEQDQQRPLTRRELRLREMGETGALDLSEVTELAPDSPAATEAPAPSATEQGEIEISPFHEDGTPRSRREMRQLREEALAAQSAGSGTPQGTEASAVETEAPAVEAEAPAVEAESAAEEPAVEISTVEEPAQAPAEREDIVADAPVAESADNRVEAELASEPVVVKPLTGEMDFDSLMSPPTEPFTVEELRAAEKQAEAAAETDGPADAVAEIQADAAEAELPTPIAAPVAPSAETIDSAEDSETAPAAEEAEPAAKTKRRFPWKRSRGADESAAGDAAAVEGAAAADAPAEAAEAVDVADEASPETDPAPAADVILETVEAVVVEEAPEVPAAEPITAEVVPEPVTGPVVPDETIAFAAVAEPEAAPAKPEPEAAPKTSYSFPDIAPPEEWRSVFDDPATRNLTTPGAPEEQGDFDDLISRAVAQEGSAGGTNTSALILPTMPEDTGGLTGPLGGTGELYVTGSLKLPKSLGETGGHSALHDSIEMDPITGELTGDPQITGEGPAPISARRAVSARMDSSIPVVAKPAKEHSKLPLVLSLTGGGLLLAVVALGIWGASNGMFG
ncbi:hypothetical protein EDF60_1443 [Leucobacter luti]|uniref:hypothetical protein n=1 Tax=Leucobacter luti TaxID=340320 RepID=UPI001045243A|nr:hypothetical protein [Leucobacter luti]MCW2287641.1 hypothetical protein [Leucobacter luti]TCK46193.1 hypothetical protein EDF60_1443 [Leucobacter luti]